MIKKNGLFLYIYFDNVFVFFILRGSVILIQLMWGKNMNPFIFPAFLQLLQENRTMFIENGVSNYHFYKDLEQGKKISIIKNEIHIQCIQCTCN